MARKLGSRDKKKRVLKKNRYGLTVDDIRNERKRTAKYGVLGLGVGSVIGALGYGLGIRPRIQSKLNDANKVLKTVLQNAEEERMLSKSGSAQSYLMRNQQALKNVESAKQAKNMLLNSKLGLKAGSILTGAALGSMGALGYLANKRAKKTREYRKKMGYKYPSNKIEKYNILNQI